MLEGEELFIELQQMHKIGGSKTKWLMENGYITDDYIPTNKAKVYISEFVGKYRDPLITAMKKFNNDQTKVMKEIGLKKSIAFFMIARTLADEGLFSPRCKHPRGAFSFGVNEHGTENYASMRSSDVSKSYTRAILQSSR